MTRRLVLLLFGLVVIGTASAGKPLPASCNATPNPVGIGGTVTITGLVPADTGAVIANEVLLEIQSADSGFDGFWYVPHFGGQFSFDFTTETAGTYVVTLYDTTFNKNGGTKHPKIGTCTFEGK